jgi:[acyl-carrier-protein] S-malonyltransferase
MNKTAFLFSGQGSQYVGMGKELCDNFSVAREVFDKAEAITDMDLRSLCFCGPEEILSRTENTQPGMVTTSLAIAAILEENNIHADYAAGLSLGEYSGLIYAGVFSFEDGISLIKKRGSIMQNAVPEGHGAMAAILGLDRQIVNECCESLGKLGIVEVANYNCPGQIVISGEKVPVEKAMIELKERGALKTIMLNVSGPFHSSMLKKAGEELETEIKRVQINAPKKMIISNYDNKFYDDDYNNTIYKLKNQISSSVWWEDNIRTLIAEGIENFIEVGPGKTLISFVRKIDRSKKTYNVEDMGSLQKLLSEFK